MAIGNIRFVNLVKRLRKGWIRREMKKDEYDEDIDVIAGVEVSFRSNLRLCPKCYCMTKTINGRCGKCGGMKDGT